MTKNFLVVGYYTPRYKEHASEFVESCLKNSVPVYCEQIDDLGDWDKNTHYKPDFIKKCLSKFPLFNIIYVDVDARIEKYPELFNTLDCDIAFYKGNVWGDSRVEVLSGTIFFRNNKISHEILDNWSNNCNTHTREWDQVLLERSVPPETKVTILPIEYCAIFDSPRIKNKEVVISHLQASRTLKTRS